VFCAEHNWCKSRRSGTGFQQSDRPEKQCGIAPRRRLNAATHRPTFNPLAYVCGDGVG
jgi:hypothetical protein